MCHPAIVRHTNEQLQYWQQNTSAWLLTHAQHQKILMCSLAWTFFMLPSVIGRSCVGTILKNLKQPPKTLQWQSREVNPLVSCAPASTSRWRGPTQPSGTVTEPSASTQTLHSRTSGGGRHTSMFLTSPCCDAFGGFWFLRVAIQNQFRSRFTIPSIHDLVQCQERHCGKLCHKGGVVQKYKYTCVFVSWLRWGLLY